MKLARLKEGMGDKERVIAWLDHIGETSPEGRAMVLEACANGYEGGTAAEVRAFFVERHRTMGLHDKGGI